MWVRQDPKRPGTRQLKTQSSKIKYELQFDRFVESVDCKPAFPQNQKSEKISRILDNYKINIAFKNHKS